LRIRASSGCAPLYLVPAIAAFLGPHPKIEVELSLSDHFVDLLDGGFDLGVRIGEMPDSTLKAKHLADSRRVVFAAPAYFAQYGRPKWSDQLVHHQCVVRTAGREGYAWPFTIDGKVKPVKVGGRFCTSGAAANQAAVHGIGIANALLWQVRGLVDQGRVELILTRFEPPPVPIHAVWVATRVPPAKTRMFVEFLATRLKSERL
jgi:DNA-binding transcriptional LysR family regulator